MSSRSQKNQFASLILDRDSSIWDMIEEAIYHKAIHEDLTIYDMLTMYLCMCPTCKLYMLLCYLGFSKFLKYNGKEVYVALALQIEKGVRGELNDCQFCKKRLSHRMFTIWPWTDPTVDFPSKDSFDEVVTTLRQELGYGKYPIEPPIPTPNSLKVVKSFGS